MKIDVSGLLQRILPKCNSDTELDHWLLEECRDRFGTEHAAAYKAISDLLARRAPDHGGSRLGAAIAMADTSSRIQFGTTVNRQVYSSLDEMPPEIRERAEKMMREGKGTMVTENVMRWDSRDGTPPPPEIAERIRAHMRAEGGDAPGLRVQVSGGNALKWILILIVLLLIVGIAAAIMLLRGNTLREESLKACVEQTSVCSSRRRRDTGGTHFMRAVGPRTDKIVCATYGNPFGSIEQFDATRCKTTVWAVENGHDRR